MSQVSFHPLPIASITPETDQAVTVAFRIKEELAQQFTYKAGQYLTLKFVVNGKEERRAYSMCSAPHDDEIAVTVKRVKGGIVSNHIADALKAGDIVDAMPPQGRFLASPEAAARRDYFLFGAGSGITPLMSILRSILEEEPKSSVYLLYGNRDENNIIFERQLADLQQRYEGQLLVEHILSRPKKYKVGGLKGLFSSGKPKWEGNIGRIDIPAVQRFMTANPGKVSDKQYYICGPGQMIDNVEQALLGLGVHKEFIHAERFVSANDVKKNKTSTDVVEGGKVFAKLSGKDVEVTLKPGQTILDGLLESGATPPYSCLAGACSTCMAKVTKGGVKMDVCFAIDDDEIAEGYILACQSHPTTPEVYVDFDV
ncbi:ferredoxin--NADP reductase [Neolewinella agarilytica]|uniref:Ring-1,2-phenylacetyl-CoA epoxidase subunit PaaE n=1 Tax=Neolewinella agarilytica TaxID=478744 RepID=A0A1H9JCN0_9BACT|nr:ferredoxin--NADP reductase [Neolewinella agarilytica]SEQ84592.1 ring-1,2-phenylacetyl-CoA epoxidase subunit PaaE [Neolewinella agarilytica]